MPQSAPVTLPAVERGSRFVTARRGKRPARGRESPLPGIIVGLALVLLLVVAVIYVASAVGG